jgi:hypothetical protein
MKNLFYIVICLVAGTQVAHAQQLTIQSFSFPASVYFCNGISLQPEGIGFDFGIYNNTLLPDTLIILDSCEVFGTRNAFTTYLPSFDTIPNLESEGEIYTPPSPGYDTFRIVAFYKGTSTEGEITFVAEDIGITSLEGLSLTKSEVGNGNAVDEPDMILASDTLHDQFLFPLVAGGPPANENNKAVQITSCGGDEIDTVREVGDFSEINFEMTPTAPFEVLADSSISFPYTVIPQHVGTFPHFLVFHTVSGHYLVWSFEYSVYPASGVEQTTPAASGLTVFPNPASGELQILGDEIGTIHLFDLLGRERMVANDDGSGATLDVSHLEPGTYFLRLGNQSAKIEIAR